MTVAPSDRNRLECRDVRCAEQVRRRGAGRYPIGRGVPLVALAIACGSSESPPKNDEDVLLDVEGCTPVTSGSRLKATRWIADDGSWTDETRIGVWRDTALGVDCFYRLASDGVLRCLPGRVQSASYADPGCTLPVVLPSEPACTGVETPPYVLEPLAAQCGVAGLEWPYAVFAVGGTVSLTSYYSRAADGTCQENLIDATLYSVASELLPPTDFVSAELVASTGKRIVRQTLIGEDGSRGLAPGYRLFDSAIDDYCRLGLAADGAQRCLPTLNGRAPGTFLDASCTRPAVEHAELPCRQRSPVAIVEESVPSAIPGCLPELYGRLHIFELAPPVLPNLIYYQIQTESGALACELNDLPADREYSELTSEVLASTFLAFTVQAVACSPLGVSGERLRMHSWVSSDGQALGGALFDSATDEPCYFSLATDGAWRCLPVRAASLGEGGLFADADCTRRVASVDRCSGFTSNYAVGFGQVTEQCDPSDDRPAITSPIFELGAAYASGPVYYRGPPESESCLPVEQAFSQTAEEFRARYALRLVSHEVPPGNFVAAHLETE